MQDTWASVYVIPNEERFSVLSSFSTVAKGLVQADGRIEAVTVSAPALMAYTAGIPV